ncbi:MAG: hypothetical protein HY040_05030 [Planctomycetes bacterium]|nr:hypothetical protein [Planctomycetota bacterium]
MRKRWKLIGTAAAIVVAFFVYRAVRADPRLAEIRQQREELMTKMQEISDPEEQKRLWGEFRESMKDLTPEQRRALGADAKKRRDEEDKRYYTLSNEDKTKWLDRQIDRMEEMKKRWDSTTDKKKGGGNPGGSGPGQSGKGNWSNLSNEEKELRRKQNIDKTTPEERARRDQIRKDLAARREQRGLSPATNPFGR